MKKTIFYSSLLSFVFLFLFSMGNAQTGLAVTVTGTAACDHDGTATATVANGVGPYTYLWTYGNTHITVTSASNTNTITNLPGGFVICEVTDVNNLMGYGYYQGQPPFYLFAGVIPDTCNQGVGSAIINVNGGTGPYTYLWSNSQTTATATGLFPGTYDCSVTDAVGCNLLLSEADTIGATVWNTANFTISSSSTPSSCFDGTATATGNSPGVPPFSYYWFTTPVQTTQTATGLDVGWYQVRVTDATGCYGDVYVTVNQGAVPFQVTSTETDETCLAANGAITQSVTGGTPPYTYLWSTGATTSGISGLSYGSYSCHITDAGGCPVNKYYWLQRLSPLSLSISNTQSACAQSTGTATVSVTGGTGPFIYSWSNGQTTQTATGLAQGYYYCLVTDANGCYRHAYTYVTQDNSCFVNIRGRISRDQNSNCVHDPGDVGMSNTMVNLNPGGWRTTDASGFYSFWGNPGTYTISQNAPQYYSQLCPVPPGTITLNASTPGATYSGNDFFNAPVGTVNDLRISAWGQAARPGFNQTLNIYYYNDGNTMINGTITLIHDAGVSLSSASMFPTTYNSGTQTATWSIGSINPGAWGYINVFLAVPPLAVVGTPVTHNLTIDPVSGDTTPLNNVTVSSRLISNAYDPNNKVALPGGNVSLNDTSLQYVINFQNTGNDTAFTVMVSDTLESDLDVPTFQPGVASHPYTWQITGAGIVEFTFTNIELPDSHINEAGSHGFVSFHIQAKNTIIDGSDARNTGHIYFDYNVPIVTNEALTVFGTPTANAQDIKNSGWVLFPNPSPGIFRVKTQLVKSDEVSIVVYDLHGRRIYDSGNLVANEGMFEYEVNPGVSASGMYMVELKANGKTTTTRVVIEQ